VALIREPAARRRDTAKFVTRKNGDRSRGGRLRAGRKSIARLPPAVLRHHHRDGAVTSDERGAVVGTEPHRIVCAGGDREDDRVDARLSGPPAIHEDVDVGRSRARRSVPGSVN